MKHYLKHPYFWMMIVVLIVACWLSGCTTTHEIPPPVKQDQLILVVPNELLQPIDPLITIDAKKEQK